MVVCNKVKCEMKFAKDERGEVRNSRGKGRLLEEEERAQDFRVFSDEKRVLGPWISFASLVLSLGQLPTTSPGPKMEATRWRRLVPFVSHWTISRPTFPFSA